ncbi:hypothetical protein [Achromobacter xylosoxidans]|uniref:hypothetical protein n=1 Tax=Alcaligenes xylosoxydans xylosoxydans TaxID=85698 RepID=UPI00292CB0B5|nr:hypothetical protein [Achromobacter xylosoxidans]WOB72085.1 hypothetical protein PZA07_22760 [Achromobacter xylosoxidans]
MAASPQDEGFEARVGVMVFVVTGALREASAAPRGRAMAWGAAGLACCLHVLVACLLWRAADDRRPAPGRGDDFFVTLLPPPATAPTARPTYADGPPQAGPAEPSPPAPRPSMPAPPAVAAPAGALPRQRASLPRDAGPSSSSASAPPAAAPAHDFRWRAEDAAALGAPRARGQARVDLAPKAPAEPSALAKGIAQSARPPCRQAHAHLGLLAVPFLLADTVRDGGCKW